MKVLTLAITIILNGFCAGVNISSKLDFDQLHSTSHQLSIPSNKKNEQTIRSDLIENTGIVCTLSGCNTTKSDIKSQDSIQADIVVHVKTSIDLNKNNKTKKLVDDIPDVPIIFGYSGVNDNNNQRSNEVKSVEYSYSSTSPSIIPVYSINSESRRNNPSITPISSYAGYENIQHMHAHKLDINKQTPSTIIVAMKKINVPYFEPSYNNHYYGEHPPPQYLPYSSIIGSTNPIEFKSITKSSNPSLWSNKIKPEFNQKHTVKQGNVCSCGNQHTPGLEWYPAYRLYDENPIIQINDKLEKF